MARQLHKLSHRFAETVTKAGIYGDGGQLFLRVKPNGSKSWVFIYQWRRKRREMGLGVFPDVSVAKARTKAADARELLADGKDPIGERDAEKGRPTFGALADQVVEDLKPGFRNPKHAAQWTYTLGTLAAPLRELRVDEITTDDVLKVLKPLWTTKPETASRLRGRIERVLDAARVRGFRTAENPARWRGQLSHLLPPPKKLSRGKHAAMPYEQVPAFMRMLRSREGVAARALEFAILTAARTGEVLGAQWSEFDLEAKVWTVPRERMKAGRPHRVPLCKRAVAIIEEMKKLSRADHVFPGTKRDAPLSNMSLTAVLKRMKLDAYTVHGFRSAFRDWAGDETHHPHEAIEFALAHVVGSKTEAAYRRSDALDHRKRLMDDWAAYCSRPPKLKAVNG